jgi:antitoxin ParD1/3/4
MDSNDRTTSMNISLPMALRSFVEERVEALSYTSASEYVRELIRKDRERRASEEKLEGLLVEGLSSGPVAEWTEEDWASIRSRVAERLAKRRSG